MKARLVSNSKEVARTSIQKFKRAAKNRRKFSDAEVEKMFFDVGIVIERDVVDVVMIFSKYRPKLLAKLIAKYIRTTAI